MCASIYPQIESGSEESHDVAALVKRVILEERC